MTVSTHHCFERKTLVDFQLGKLSQDQITGIYAACSVCPICRRRLAELDDVADPMLVALRKREEEVNQEESRREIN